MSDTTKQLHAAWDDLLAELGRARDAIDQPELLPAPPSDRNLAEGYRYLLGFVHSAIERAFHEDPRFPVFRNALSVVNKATIENADAVYFMAPIDGRESYRLRGAAIPAGRKRPQYLIFELSDGCIAGDSGSLAELRPGVKAQTGRLDSTTLESEDDGSFEILLAPERPAGHRGNFIATHRRTSRPNPDDPDGSPDRHACWVSGRQLFYDWEKEDPVHLSLTQVGAEGAHPEPITPDVAAAQLRRLGALVRGQMHFWNQFYTVLLEVYGKRDGAEGERFMPRNKFNAVNAASGATGGGQSTNLYAGGIFELEPDEALIVENHVPLPPQYMGFHLGNLWGESIDYANHQSSLNGFQVEPDPDRVFRYVVAHEDPGIPNWLDTTGHREGFLTPRWAYTETPPNEQWPEISAKKVKFPDIRNHLPDETRTISPEERRQRIAIRQDHVKRRFRVF